MSGYFFCSAALIVASLATAAVAAHASDRRTITVATFCMSMTILNELKFRPESLSDRVLHQKVLQLRLAIHQPQPAIAQACQPGNLVVEQSLQRVGGELHRSEER